MDEMPKLRLASPYDIVRFRGCLMMRWQVRVIERLETMPMVAANGNEFVAV